MKRKINNDEQEADSLKKGKICDLLSMQLEDWLEEQKLDCERMTCLQSFGNEVKNTLLSSRSSKRSYELVDVDWLTSCDIKLPLKLPFGLKLEDIKSLKPFVWKPPESVELISDQHMFQPDNSEPWLHMEMIIPKEVFGAKDFLNFTFHLKRAFYLCWAAKLLKKSGYYIKFLPENYDSLRQCLLIFKHEETVNAEAVCLHVSPSREFSKLQRFYCSKSNLRPSFCLKRMMAAAKVATNVLSENEATPFYNACIMEDMRRRETAAEFAEFFQNKPNLRQSILIASRWLKRKRLSERADGFNEFLLNAWFVHLFNSGLVDEEMSLFNSLAAFFNSLSKLKGFQRQHSLCQIDEDRFEEYRKFYEFVLVDSTGYFNVAYGLSTIVFEHLCIEAENAAIKLCRFSEFENLFLTEEAFSASYDVYIRFRLFDKYMESEFAKLFPFAFYDSCGNYLRAFRTKMLPILKRSWSFRVNLIEIETATTSSDLQNTSKNDGSGRNFVDVIVGTQVLPGWDSTLIRGPPAKTAEAQEFREFWGEKCELRKFADNAICEAVLWGEKSTSPSTLSKIFQYVMHRHLKLDNASFIKRSFGFGFLDQSSEKRYDVVSKSYEKLSRKLRDLQDLPLLIASVHPVSAYLRRTLPVPPPFSDEVMGGKFMQVDNSMAFPIPYCSPPFLESVEVHLTMEHSGKWGEDLDAIAHLKTAFYIALAKSLKTQDVNCIPYTNYLLVILDGVVFRLIIVYPKEAYLIKMRNGIKNGILKESVESKLFERKYVAEPQLAAYLYSVSHQYPAFSNTCRLALRWLSAQMLSNYIDDIVIEIIVASVFINPLFLSPPQTIYSGFLHFLMLLSRHKWLLKPLLVDFNSEWNESDREKIESEFVKLRPILPAMVICTPADRSGIMWTKEEPQPLILKRIISLASSTAEFLQKNVVNLPPLSLESLFYPELSVFDTIIYLHNLSSIRRTTDKYRKPRHCCPIVDYNPVRKFLKSLRENFHTVALFFFDKYGEPNKIGVVWRKTVMENRPANVSNSLCRRKMESSGELMINVESIMEDFVILGGNLVHKVVSGGNA